MIDTRILFFFFTFFLFSFSFLFSFFFLKKKSALHSKSEARTVSHLPFSEPAAGSGSPSRCGELERNGYSEYNGILLFRGLGKRGKRQMRCCLVPLKQGGFDTNTFFVDLSSPGGESLNTNRSLLPLLSSDES